MLAKGIVSVEYVLVVTQAQLVYSSLFRIWVGPKERALGHVVCQPVAGEEGPFLGRGR
ncbi:MAG: hypothetical protein ACD_55C00097G0001 [uncultured bacterium]|nr:MAG: hypothetical protein ACD_55C00097G0001 [uncultured bacterium]